MKKLLIASLCLFSLAAVASAAPLTDPALQRYLQRSLPNCPGSNVQVGTMEDGPAGFTTYKVTQTSTDSYCGRTSFLLKSNKTNSVLVGDAFPLPESKDTLDKRVGAVLTRLMGRPVTAVVAKEANGEGLRRATITNSTPYGPFSFQGWVDSSNKFFLMGRLSPKTADPGEGLVQALGIANAATRGNTMGRVRILEVSDFQCPTCKRAHEMLEPIIRKNIGKISYSRVDLPLFEHHDWVVEAALAGRAIQKAAPGKYWGYVDYIFANQEAINKNNVQTMIRDFVTDNDLDWSKIEPLYRSADAKKALLEQKARAYSNGIFGTPTFIVNGQIVSYGPDGEYIRSVLQKALAAK